MRKLFVSSLLLMILLVVPVASETARIPYAALSVRMKLKLLTLFPVQVFGQGQKRVTSQSEIRPVMSG